MALSIADRGYVLSTGEIVLERTQASELLHHEDLKRAYLGRMSRAADRRAARPRAAASSTRAIRCARSAIASSIDDQTRLPRRQLARVPAARDRRAAAATWSASSGASAASGAGTEGWLDLPLAVGDRLGARRARRGARPDGRRRLDHGLLLQARVRGARRASRSAADHHRRRQLPDRPLRARGDGARRGASSSSGSRFDSAAGPTVEASHRDRPADRARHVLARLVPLGAHRRLARDQRRSRARRAR